MLSCISNSEAVKVGNKCRKFGLVHSQSLEFRPERGLRNSWCLQMSGDFTPSCYELLPLRPGGETIITGSGQSHTVLPSDKSAVCVYNTLTTQGRENPKQHPFVSPQ